MSEDIKEAEITRRVRGKPRKDREVRDAPLMLAPEEGGFPPLPEEAQEDERFVYRWVRVMLDGKDDVENVLRREREGWVFVTPETLPGSYKMPVRATGAGSGAVGVGDVALMRLPREIAEARRRWLDKRAADQMQAVNSQLYRENDHRMPIFNESKTAVRTGRNAEFDPN